jgi:hypothetical protein
MMTAPCICIGPVARTAKASPARRVIFTLGGGGEYWNLTGEISVARFMGEFRTAAETLKAKFDVEPIFAAGPLLNGADDSLAPFSVVRPQNLHEMFGPATVVVTRGGYNTCWEAIAAGAGLITVGEHLAHGVEDVGARGRFLAAEGLARHVTTDATAIIEACMALIERPPMTANHYLRRSINAGLGVAREAILGPPSIPIHSLLADMAEK